MDFARPDQAYNILPSGQSGNFTVKYYRNQAEMYVKGRFRKELMNEKEIQAECKSKLTIVPIK
jgi:penicillin amidase